MAFQQYANGQAIYEGDLDNLMKQMVVVVADATERNAIPALSRENLLVFREDTETFETYNGSAWSTLICDRHGVSGAVVTPTLLNGWGNFGSVYAPASIRKVDKTVYLSGLISGGTATVGTLILTLPVGYRPAERLLFPVLSNNTTFGRMDIYNTGNVQLGGAVSSTWVSLNSISFQVEG